MSQPLPRRLKVSLLVAVSLVAALPVFGPRTASGADQCPVPTTRLETGEPVYEASALPPGVNAVACEMVGAVILVETIDGNRAGVAIPRPGESVSFHGFGLVQGVEVSALVDEDGNLVIDESEVLTPETTPPTVNPCSDGRFNLLNRRMNSGETYFINISTIPATLNAGATVSVIDSGIRAWPQQYNDCGFADQVSATVSYGGNSEAYNSVQAGVSQDGEPATFCVSRGFDTVSVISFGPTPGALGGTCRFGVGGTIVGADIKFDTGSTQWTLQPRSGTCAAQVDLGSIAAHEGGHWWGMAHVRAAYHPTMTMRDGGVESVTCNDALRTLGKGDILGMRALYP